MLRLIILATLFISSFVVSGQNQYLMTENLHYEEGDVIDVHIMSDVVVDIVGIEGSLEWDFNFLQLMNIEEQKIKYESMALTSLDVGVISFLTYQYADKIEHGDTLFSFRFKALTKGELSDYFNLVNHPLPSQVTSADINLESHPLQMFFWEDYTTSTTESKDEVQLMYPNPTTGLVYLPEVQTVEIYNALGHLLKTDTTEIVDLTKYDSGLYFLRTKSGTSKIVKR